MGLIGNLYYKAISKNSNIFCYGIDWRFQYMLSECLPDYNFYGDFNSFMFDNYDCDNIERFYNSKRLPRYRDMSLIIINDESQYEHCKKYSFNQHIPILLFNHSKIKSNLDIDAVYDIPYYIDIDKFKRSNKDYTNVISGNFGNDAIEIINKISGLIKTNIIGNLNRVKYDEYIKIMDDSMIYSYLTDNLYNRIDLLDAMAAGCIVICNDSILCKKHIKHMENGIITDSYESYNNAVKLILQSRSLRETISNNAVNYIRENFNDKTKLKNIVETASKKYYTRNYK